MGLRAGYPGGGSRIHGAAAGARACLGVAVDDHVARTAQPDAVVAVVVGADGGPPGGYPGRLIEVRAIKISHAVIGGVVGGGRNGGVRSAGGDGGVKAVDDTRLQIQLAVGKESFVKMVAGGGQQTADGGELKLLFALHQAGGADVNTAGGDGRTIGGHRAPVTGVGDEFGVVVDYHQGLHVVVAGENDLQHVFASRVDGGRTGRSIVIGVGPAGSPVNRVFGVVELLQGALDAAIGGVAGTIRVFSVSHRAQRLDRGQQDGRGEQTENRKSTHYRHQADASLAERPGVVFNTLQHDNLFLRSIKIHKFVKKNNILQALTLQPTGGKLANGTHLGLHGNSR